MRESAASNNKSAKPRGEPGRFCAGRVCVPPDLIRRAHTSWHRQMGTSDRTQLIFPLDALLEHQGKIKSPAARESKEMDNETQARLDRVRDAARTLIAERDWFRDQADTIDAALRALGIDTSHASAKPLRTRLAKATLRPGKRVGELAVTEYRTNLEIVSDILGERGGALDIRALQNEMRKRGRELGYSAMASLCSKGAAKGYLWRAGVGVYRLPCHEDLHQECDPDDGGLTSHLGEMPLREVDHPREADALVAPVPAHLLDEHLSKEPMNYLTFDPMTGKREQATEYHVEDEHEGEGE
jgi:hypothetical protein